MNLKKLRKEKGWTQTDLANRLGVTLRTVQNYEKKEIPKMAKLAIKYLTSDK